MRHQNKIKGFLLSLLILPISFFAFSADEASPEAAETSVEPTQNQTPKTVIPRSFTPSEMGRIAALTKQIEKNAANEIKQLSFQGENFLTLYRPAQSNDPQGCIVLLHGNNEHPDWPNVINPVRTQLTQNSWCTLSIEVPDNKTKEALSVTQPPQNDEAEKEDETLPNEETVFGRITASIAFANEEGINNISLLGYGTGATYAIKYSASTKLEGGALILISASMPNQLPYFPYSELLKESLQPTLDYYIQPNKLNKHYANARRIAMKQRPSNAPTYTQIKVTSNSQFAMDEKQLIQRIRGFLKQNTQQREQLKVLPPFSKSLFYQSP